MTAAEASRALAAITQQLNDAPFTIFLESVRCGESIADARFYAEAYKEHVHDSLGGVLRVLARAGAREASDLRDRLTFASSDAAIERACSSPSMLDLTLAAASSHEREISEAVTALPGSARASSDALRDFMVPFAAAPKSSSRPSAAALEADLSGGMHASPLGTSHLGAVRQLAATCQITCDETEHLEQEFFRLSSENDKDKPTERFRGLVERARTYETVTGCAGTLLLLAVFVLMALVSWRVSTPVAELMRNLKALPDPAASTTLQLLLEAAPNGGRLVGDALSGAHSQSALELNSSIASASAELEFADSTVQSAESAFNRTTEALATLGSWEPLNTSLRHMHLAATADTPRSFSEHRGMFVHRFMASQVTDEMTRGYGQKVERGSSIPIAPIDRLILTGMARCAEELQNATRAAAESASEGALLVPINASDACLLYLGPFLNVSSANITQLVNASAFARHIFLESFEPGESSGFREPYNERVHRGLLERLDRALEGSSSGHRALLDAAALRSAELDDLRGFRSTRLATLSELHSIRDSFEDTAREESVASAPLALYRADAGASALTSAHDTATALALVAAEAVSQRTSAEILAFVIAAFSGLVYASRRVARRFAVRCCERRILGALPRVALPGEGDAPPYESVNWLMRVVPASVSKIGNVLAPPELDIQLFLKGADPSLHRRFSGRLKEPREFFTKAGLPEEVFALFFADHVTSGSDSGPFTREIVRQAFLIPDSTLLQFLKTHFENLQNRGTFQKIYNFAGFEFALALHKFQTTQQNTTESSLALDALDAAVDAGVKLCLKRDAYYGEFRWWEAPVTEDKPLFRKAFENFSADHDVAVHQKIRFVFALYHSALLTRYTRAISTEDFPGNFAFAPKRWTQCFPRSTSQLGAASASSGAAGVRFEQICNDGRGGVREEFFTVSLS